MLFSLTGSFADLIVGALETHLTWTAALQPAESIYGIIGATIKCFTNAVIF